MRDDGDMTEPMNQMLLSALARQRGHETQMLVLQDRSVKDAVSSFRPDVMAFSCITGNQRTYINAAAEAKNIKRSIITAFGGPHFTYFPGEMMRHPEAMDLICVGEGDDAWLEILAELEAGRMPDQIQNVVTKENVYKVLEIPADSRKVQLGLISDGSKDEKYFDAFTMKRGIVRSRKVDLDTLPFLDRGLVYDSTAFRKRFKRTHMASRGCPFRCAYCFEPQFNDLYKGLGRVRQYYGVDRFLEELKYVMKNWDTRYFKFYDDVFPPFPSPDEVAWHEEFCSKYPVRVGLPFHILTRCDNVMKLHEKGVNVIRDWKKAGLASLTMSIESGNQFIHDHVIVRDMSQEQVKAAFAIAYAEGVYTFPNTIVGIPSPILPREDDPHFDEKLALVKRDLGILKTVNGTRMDFDEALKLNQTWFPNEKSTALRRRSTVQFLGNMGLRHDNIATNVESVMFTLKCKPGFAEFLTLFPYPGTKATDWCEARGDFDGDFAKLHASYQTKSPLSCFSEEEKEVIQNLTLIGTFLTLFWGSRNRFIQRLARPMTSVLMGMSSTRNKRLQALFLWLYTVSKGYMHRTRIYPIRYSFREKIRFYLEMIQLDLWKQRKERRRLVKRPDRKLALGGPVS